MLNLTFSADAFMSGEELMRMLTLLLLTKRLARRSSIGTKLILLTLEPLCCNGFFQFGTKVVFHKGGYYRTPVVVRSNVLCFLSGTKVMCREGGCGCCVVSVTRRDLSSSKDVTMAVNSVRSFYVYRASGSIIFKCFNGGKKIIKQTGGNKIH